MLKILLVLFLFINLNPKENIKLNIEYNFDEKIYPLGIVHLEIFCKNQKKIGNYSLGGESGELYPLNTTLYLEEFKNCDTFNMKISTLCIDANLIDSSGHPKRLLSGEKIFLGLTPKYNEINLKFKFMKDSMKVTKAIH